MRIRGNAARLDETIQRLKRRLVELAMIETQGVKSHAAALLGLKYSTFWDQVQHFGLDDVADTTASIPRLADIEELVLLVADGEGPWRIEIPVSAGGIWNAAVEGLTRGIVRRLLRRSDGNVVQAAELAEMNYTTFHALVGRLGKGAAGAVAG